MHAFILAGGFATRLWPLTEKRAKPLLPLAGKPMVSHIVEQIPPEMPVTVSTNSAFGAQFEEWRKSTGRANVSIVVEHTTTEDEKLGALGAVAQWVREHDVRDDILLLTGDNYFGFPLARFLATIEPGSAAIAACDIGDRTKASAFGTVLLAEDGRHISSFEEKPKEPRSSLVSTGCFFLPAATLPILLDFAREHPDNVGGIVEEYVRREIPVTCFTFTEPWFDVGSFEVYLAATEALVAERILAAKTAQLTDTICTGSVVLGERSTVTSSELENVVVFDDCVIEGCVLRDCIIDNGCHLRGIDLQKKMLRAGTTLTQ